MTEPTTPYTVTGQCEFTTCTRPAKPGGRFCSPKHRAAWNRQHGGVIPARVQSISPTQNGDRVVVVRVQATHAHRIADWCPCRDVELLDGDG